MKKKIIKLWGVGMILVLMASLLVVGATPAAADSLAWTNVLTLPSALTGQIAPAATNINTANLVVAPNGDLFAIDTVAGNVVHKSTDGGTTWVPSAPIAGAVVDLAASPSYTTDNTVVALGGGPPAQVYISVNGGATFAALGATLTAGETGASIAISPNYVYPTGEIMVGTQAAGAATYGDVYIWGRLGVLTWTPMLLGEDVTSVAYSPNYLIDATRLAVGSTVANGTVLHTLVSSDATFDLTLPVAVTGGVVASAAIAGTGDANGIVTSDIALPSDFNASVAFSRTCYVATNSAFATDDIFRVTVGSVAPAVGINVAGTTALTDFAMTSIVHVGTYAAGKIYAGALATTLVYQTSNPTVPAGFATWTWCLAAPSGVGTTYVALAADFATSNKMYAGTTGANSALSVSNDGGVYFHQTGMIATNINAITDYVAASPTEIYMVTADTALANVESLWKSVNGGVTWYRIMSLATAANNGQIRLSESYATDNTLAFINVGNATFQISMDGGSTWTPRTVPTAGFTVADMIIKDAYTYYVGNAAVANVQATTNGGWTWQIGPTALTGGAAVNEMAYDAATGHILVGDTVGGVYLSTNANLTYLAQGVIGGPTIVAFDANYATNNIIYAADTTPGTAGVQRYNTTTPLIPWAVIDGGATAIPADIVCAPDGALYATDATPSTIAPAVIVGGMQRCLNPTAPVFPGSPAFEMVSGGDGLAATSQLGKMTLTEGSNIIYALNDFGGTGVATMVSTYTDILTMAVPTILSPAEGDIVLAAAAAVSISPVANNPGGTYQVQWSTRSDYLGAVGNIIAIPGIINAINLNVVGNTVPAGATIYIRVQTTGPVFGPWSDTVSFETQLTAGAINAPAILSPIAGGTGPGGYNAELNPTFNWGVIGGATNYEFQLAMDASFDDPIVDLTGADALGNVLVYKLDTMTLEYGTTYYWRVRAISATSETAWSAAVGFTTMAEPAETEPPVTITDPPDVIITIPPAEPAPTITLEPTPIEETPAGYIWAIIIIGAVLVIAVIVLIVRTRRSV
jgi:hypothetical protein